jgi:hypothetical protein
MMRYDALGFALAFGRDLRKLFKKTFWHSKRIQRLNFSLENRE